MDIRKGFEHCNITKEKSEIGPTCLKYLAMNAFVSIVPIFSIISKKMLVF